MKVPRNAFGAVSAWYNGHAALKAPTPKPATSLPIMTCSQVLKAVTWMMVPTLKTMHSTLIAHLRPNLSASGAPISEPIAVNKESD